MIHLDTTFLVDLLRESRRGPGPATAYLDSIEGEELAISVHVLCELYAGAELSNDPSREIQAIRRVCAGLEAPLVTRNLDHFTRVPGLQVLSY